MTRDEQRRKKAQGARLRIAREEAGFRSAREAALSNGWKESSYRAHEAGTRTIGQDDAERYAARFRTAGVDIDAKRILFGSGAALTEIASYVHPPGVTEDREGPLWVPLIDKVAAGRMAAPSSQIPIQDVPLLAFADLGPGEFFATRVDGTSMDRISPDGSIIVVNRRDRTLISGKYYLFAFRGEVTFKRWQGGEPPYLQPYSTDPIHEPIFLRRKRDMEVIGRVKRTVLDL